MGYINAKYINIPQSGKKSYIQNNLCLLEHGDNSVVSFVKSCGSCFDIFLNPVFAVFIKQAQGCYISTIY